MYLLPLSVGQDKVQYLDDEWLMCWKMCGKKRWKLCVRLAYFAYLPGSAGKNRVWSWDNQQMLVGWDSKSYPESIEIHFKINLSQNLEIKSFCMLLCFWEVPGICTLLTNVCRSFSLSLPTHVRWDCSLNNIATASYHVFHNLSLTGHAFIRCLLLNEVKLWQLFLANALHVFRDVQLYFQYLHVHFTINYLLTDSDWSSHARTL